MDENLYNKELVCPVCSKKLKVTKVKSRACLVDKRDSDFCVYYKGINPLYYDAWVCGNCGYAAQSDKFLEIPPKDANLITEKIAPQWNKRDFFGERNVDDAIEAFKLILINHQIRKAKSSELAKVCMRIAWLYREKEDSSEENFMKFALKYYTEAYETEHFPADKLDENTCAYIIGELNRRTKNYEEAVKWFSRVISSPDARKNTALIENARDMYQLVKEELKS